MTIILYDYWRSSACYRVRIALNLLGLAYETVPVNLLEGAQTEARFLAQNPQGYVPALEIDGHTLTQSLAIMDYLDIRAGGGLLSPTDGLNRTRALQLAHLIAMDIHPLCTLGVTTHVGSVASDDPEEAKAARFAWMKHYIAKGLQAYETHLGAGTQSRFSVGDTPSIADICLVPQIYNARRIELDLTNYPLILDIVAHCNDLPAFQAAQPEQVRPEG